MCWIIKTATISWGGGIARMEGIAGRGALASLIIVILKILGGL